MIDQPKTKDRGLMVLFMLASDFQNRFCFQRADNNPFATIQLTMFNLRIEYKAVGDTLK